MPTRCRRGIGSVSSAAACVVAFDATGRARARWAAGVTWTSRTAKAEWAGRYYHTTVIDAAGAIYVIGGGSYNGTYTNFNDVYASTDEGARRDRVGGWSAGVLEGVFAGVLRGAKGEN